jgi:L-alanine-DL-glutamate epimerase-like enolase superfamily enzyme
MTETVGDYLVSRLRDWHVDQVFGYPGDGINGILAAMGRADNTPRFVQSRHEEMSAFEAVGYAKFAGAVGVCLATSGPGAIHLLNGLYDAKLDHVPVVAIVGQTARSAMGGSYQQEVDLQTLFKDVASDYLVEVNVAEQLPNALDRAIRTAESERAPTAVIIPADLQEEAYTPPRHAFKQVPSSRPSHVRAVTVPHEDEIRRAADVLNAGEKVAVLVGQGARNAAQEVRDVAELTGAGVAKALLGKDVLPDDLPWVTGAIGLLGTRPSYELMRDCDTLLIVGSSFPYTQFMPEFGQAKAIQIDIDGGMIGMRYPTEVNLVGDAAHTLRALLPMLTRKDDRSWRETPLRGVRVPQQRPQPGHVGAAGDGWHPEVRGVPGHPGHRLRGSRPGPGTGGRERRHPGGHRAGVGPGTGRRPARPARRAVRPRGAADPAARHLRTGEVRGGSGAEGRSERLAPDRAGSQDQGTGVPAWPTEELMSGVMPDAPPNVARVTATAHRVPTPVPEADGTLTWDATTIVVVEARADGVSGLGWTYADVSVVDVVDGVLAPVVVGRPAADVPACWHAMQRQVRNLGRPGLASCAMSAVDIALWDLAARLCGLPLARLLGRVREAVPLYASGGFTTLDDIQLTEQLDEWAHTRGVPRVKIKIGESWGAEAGRDLARVHLARKTIGDGAELYVDANGGYSVGQACRVAAELAEVDVRWFEEPVSSDDLAGLSRVRSASAADVAAGEYGYDLVYFARMVEAQAVDCLQVDVTRCGGITEWLRVAALAAARNLEVSAHCAPNISAHAALATPNFRHVEWFVDHHRIESEFFDGVLDPAGGTVRPSMADTGHGMRLRPDAASRYRVR